MASREQPRFGETMLHLSEIALVLGLIAVGGEVFD